RGPRRALPAGGALPGRRHCGEMQLLRTAGGGLGLVDAPTVRSAADLPTQLLLLQGTPAVTGTAGSGDGAPSYGIAGVFVGAGSARRSPPYAWCAVSNLSTSACVMRVLGLSI